jgi:hypothetical protein
MSTLPVEKPASKFTILFWQKYFDLEEDDMKDRLKGCFHMGEASLADVLEKDGDDLYGPYWIATTLVVVLFIAGNWSRILIQLEEKYNYELLGMACVWVYYYWVIVPSLLLFLVKIQGVPLNDWVRVFFFYFVTC